VFDGRSRQTESSDVYSLGLILYEMVTRKAPFQQYTSAAQIIVAVAMRKERPEIPRNCPALMTRLIADCWHDDPRQRPTCSEILRQLEFMLLHELQGEDHSRASRLPASTASSSRGGSATDQPAGCSDNPSEVSLSMASFIASDGSPMAYSPSLSFDWLRQNHLASRQGSTARQNPSAALHALRMEYSHLPTA